MALAASAVNAMSVVCSVMVRYAHDVAEADAARDRAIGLARERMANGVSIAVADYQRAANTLLGDDHEDDERD